MERNTLRIRLVSFKDTAKQNLESLFYIKKLTQLPSTNVSTMILEPSDLAAAFVLSINETFDWHISEGNYCQIIFLTSKSKPKARGDAVLWFNHLVELVTDPRYNKQLQPELLCNMVLQREYTFEFSVQQIENALSVVPYEFPRKKSRQFDKVSTRQPIRGHSMKLQQFNHPVHCAICRGFVWGLHRQGFQCSQCSLVTHKKCHQLIPFWCLKSLFPEPVPLNGNYRLKFHISHTFKQHEAPFVRALVTRNHGHCNHCGAQIFRNGLKCTQCQFIIHEHCQSNVPPMCTISYNSIGEIMKRELSQLTTRFHDPKIETESDKESISSSYDLSWLGPLPEYDLGKNGPIPLPTYNDFKYIGRLGDGAFAQVYCVQHIPSNQYVAIKVADGTNEQARQQLEVERQILFRYSHGNPYMIKAYCTFHQGSTLFLVMELVEGGTLYHKIQTNRMNEEEIRFYLAELICVLQYLHSNNIVYRDLKLEHAVVCSAGHIRLVDYGLGRILKTPDETCHTYCGTYSYMAPEVQRLEKEAIEEGYSYAVDFWALGIMFVQMLCGEQLDFHPAMYPNNTTEDINEFKNLAESLELPRHISPEARACVTGLLENDPKKRLGSPNSPHGPIRDHPFFQKGRKIIWQEIDDGLFKSVLKTPPAMHFLSDTSIRRPLSTLLLDRGGHGEADWIAVSQSTCTLNEDEQFKSFDYINQSAWLELIQIDVS